MISERRVDANYILSLTGRLVREEPWLAIAAVIILSATDTAGDRFPAYWALISIPRLIATVAFQYAITFAALARSGLLRGDRRPRVGAMLGLTIVSSLGVLVGLLLLIVPGIYLLVRWSVAVPVLIGERTGVIEALRRSGEEVAGRFWIVLGVGLVFCATIVLGTAVVVILGTEPGLTVSILANLVGNAGVVGFWYAAVAIYVAGRSFTHVAEVFA